MSKHRARIAIRHAVEQSAFATEPYGFSNRESVITEHGTGIEALRRIVRSCQAVCRFRSEFEFSDEANAH